jgi:hypothetical protein
MAISRSWQVRSATIRPRAIEAYEAFDRREPGGIKVELRPEAA